MPPRSAQQKTVDTQARRPGDAGLVLLPRPQEIRGYEDRRPRDAVLGGLSKPSKSTRRVVSESAPWSSRDEGQELHSSPGSVKDAVPRRSVRCDPGNQLC